MLGRHDSLEGFQASTHLGGYIENLYPHLMSEHFMRQSWSGVENRNMEIYDLITTHTSGSIMFGSHTKWMVTFFFYYIYFFKIIVLYENI